jgi:hypothetical protein
MGSIIFLCLAISIIATIFLIKIKFNNLLRVPLIIFCAAVLLISMFLWLVVVDENRVSHGAELFIQDAIGDFRNGKLPPLSKGVTQEEEQQIRKIATNIPKGNYKARLDDVFGEFFEYNIEFENGDKYFCSVEAYGSLLTLFAKIDYSLWDFKKGERKRKGDMFVFIDGNNVGK